MVDISIETPEQTERRLRRVIQASELTVFEGPYGFSEFAAKDFPAAIDPNALAVVRDNSLWSQLAPHRGGGEAFAVFSFHFPPESDNSGFVGWLASHLKRRFGTGVFVICGQNSARGGIFDYWGCPIEIGEDVLAEVRKLVAA